MKKLFLICAAILLSLGVVGCKKNKNNPEGVEELTETYDGSEVTIVFYHTMGQNLREVLDAYIPKFNELYPNIHIEHEQVGSYDDVRNQISTELTAGEGPNIAYCYPDHVAMYNDASAVQTLDAFINSTLEVSRGDGSVEITGLTAEQKADFIPGYYAEGAAFGDGKMYSLPFSKSTEVLYYNKTFFEQHNIPVPTHWFSTDANDTTSLEAVCKRIKEIDSKSIPLGYDSESNLFITMCEQLGSAYTSATGDHFLFNNDVNKSFTRQFRSWYQAGLMTTQELLGSYTSSLFTSTTDPRSYMSIGSSAGATHQRPTAVNNVYPFEVGIAPIPQMDINNPKVISQGPSLCIFKKDNIQEVYASWLFVKFLTTNVELQARWSMESGYVPVLTSVANEPAYAAWLAKANGTTQIAALSAKQCLAQVDYYFASPAFAGSSIAREQVGRLLTKIIAAEGDVVDAAFNEAIEVCKFFQ